LEMLPIEIHKHQKPAIMLW